ncbi:PREDICTED: protein HEADING DATE 3B [Nelumbo nucifera]|uniref:Protein HEADING DATE 3B n=2 Tax=Nelumbo nucifera TaxID=4432 RepID=A0A1U7Z195_NELNU|nr:PREDICTED: protein HEADING DATE 3B [Nelumbo nucifera]DAD44511.1 TPA_asm: hypothetical protein HUJ06_002741 [Nelumbo nucifera]
MKGGKDEEKIMGPLFPRLHVNDADKGGPRAPPRNKMALYEQLSIPSQRFNSGLAPTLPLPPNNASNLVPSTSSSQGGAHERSVFSQIYVSPPTPHSRSSDGANLNGTVAECDRKSTKNANYRISNATRNLLSTNDCNSCHRPDFSNLKNYCGDKLEDEDDLRVPTYIHSGVASCSNKDLPNPNGERCTPLSPTHPSPSKLAPGNRPLKALAATGSSSMQPQSTCDKQQKTSTRDMKSRVHVRNQNEENLKECVTSRDSAEKDAIHSSTGEKNAKFLNRAIASENQILESSQADDFRRSNNNVSRAYEEQRSILLPENCVSGDAVLVELVGVEKGNISREKAVPFSRASPGNSDRSPKRAENDRDYHEDMAHESLQVGDADKNDDASETSMVDSISGLDISPDDVVGVIGPKHFWKARRAIVNQQKVFAVQVFELHRLIKVQRLIAGSPHLLFDNNPYLGKPSLKVSPAKNLTSEYALKSPPGGVKHKTDAQKPKQDAECAAENTVGEPTLPSLSTGVNKGLVSQNSSHGPHSGNPSSGPWCFHPPPGNQWLVPIMSPSEGLIYKPYVGPCPPTAGFMAPVYGGRGPLSLPPMAGDFMNTAYGVPASHQQGIGVIPGAPPVGQTYFPPYGVPVLSPGISASAVEQRNPMAGSHPNGHSERLSTGDANFKMHYQSSYNNSNQKSETISCHIWKFQTSKDSELQGSTASSPCERSQGSGSGNVAEGRDALPLFPMAPAVQVQDQVPKSHSSGQQTRVIKVVPHNRRSATESAVRIFQSIQKERQQYDSV